MVTGPHDYTADAVAAARSVLLELAHVLAEYRDSIVLVGGWVPALLFPDAGSPHIGSIDIDLALDHRALKDSGYRTIRKLLIARGYEQEAAQPFIFRRRVTVGDRHLVVEVDLLAGEYQGTGKGHRTQPIQDVRARKARGCDLAFEAVTEVRIVGSLPDGSLDSAVVRVASIVPFIVMKGMALHDRIKPKDAYDLVYCLRNYPDGLDAILQEFRPRLAHGLAREALQKIAEKFASPNHVGPRSVAEFQNVTDASARDRVTRDAFERVRYLLEGLGIQTVSDEQSLPASRDLARAQDGQAARLPRRWGRRRRDRGRRQAPPLHQQRCCLQGIDRARRCLCRGGSLPAPV